MTIGSAVSERSIEADEDAVTIIDQIILFQYWMDVKLFVRVYCTKSLYESDGRIT